MSLRRSSRTVVILSIACLLLLAACLPWSAAQADGLGGQWPLDPPPNPAPPNDGGDDGIETVITIMTLMQLIL